MVITSAQNVMLNALAAQFENPAARRTLILEFGCRNEMFKGNNSDGEQIELHISEDSIVLRTYQKNGFVRINFYDEQGYAEGETYEGRWN